MAHHPRVERLVHRLTDGGRRSVSEAAAEHIERHADPVGILVGVWRRSYSEHTGLRPSAADREQLDSIERAGKGLLWTLRLTPTEGDSPVMLHVNESTPTPVSNNVATLAFAQRLSVLDDGEVLLWEESGEHDLNGVIIPPFTRPSDIIDTVGIVPAGANGLPMATPDITLQHLFSVAAGFLQPPPRRSGEPRNPVGL